MYVMTPEFGAASQLEKIDMLDFAEFVAINKFDRKGAADALRDVAKQVQRNREAWQRQTEADAGVRHDGQPLQRRRRDRALPGAAAAPAPWACRSKAAPERSPVAATRHSTHQVPIVPGARARYLAEIADTVRGYKRLRAATRPRSRARSSNCGRRASMLRQAGPDEASACRGRDDSSPSSARPDSDPAGAQAAGDVA